jgi:glucosamine-6-phosphate deaminase
MKLSIHATPELADRAAAELLAGWLSSARTLMVAAGNTPLGLYGRIAERRLPLAGLTVLALDEYVGVPLEEPRNCANLLRRAVAEAWRIAPERFFALSSLEVEALESVRRHECRIAELGGLDAVVLGLGQNGHLGFNEPGSAEDAAGRLVDLESPSVEANRRWFGGDYAPARGVTVGLGAILAARRILLLAYGPHKAAAAKTMIEGPRSTRCPASFLQGHGGARIFLDEAAARELERRA